VGSGGAFEAGAGLVEEGGELVVGVAGAAGDLAAGEEAMAGAAGAFLGEGEEVVEGIAGAGVPVADADGGGEVVGGGRGARRLRQVRDAGGGQGRGVAGSRGGAGGGGGGAGGGGPGGGGGLGVAARWGVGTRARLLAPGGAVGE
jgi:hypothetical protein